MRKVAFGFLLILITVIAVSQETEESAEAEAPSALVEAAEAEGQIEDMPMAARGSIPEALLRPDRSETLRRPIDTVIGELGRGAASQSAYDFARQLCEALLDRDAESPALVSMHYSFLENFLTRLEVISPLSVRIGGGRNLPDGSTSFLVRFLGREMAISGELYIRQDRGSWEFDEMLLEDARSRMIEHRESIFRFDFNPYERFF